MNSQIFRSTLLLSFVIANTSFGQQPDDFSHRIAPILRKHCVECHGGKEAKGGFSINTRELLLDEGYVIPQDANGSHLLDLLSSNDPEAQMPPPKKPRVPAEEIAILRQWIEEGAEWDAGFTFAVDVYEPPLKPRKVELPPANSGREHPIDRILDAYLKEHELPAPPPIDDATFYRRVSLDLIGLLPDPEELQEFLADSSSDKRTQLVQQLLARDIDYADHWLTFWNDLLRNDYTGTGFITGGRKQISRWLYDALVWNKPYDQFTRELIAPPTADSRGFIDGIKWRGEVSAGQTLEIQFSQSISQSFLGINMKCASCHDSFIDRWTLKEAYGLAAIYAQKEMAIHRCDKPTGEIATASWLFDELGQVDPQAPQPERLQQLANLMTHPENGRFTRTIANRLWAQLMGRGIVHPLDAMQTEPWNADLLDYLAVFLSDHSYDLKQLLAHIATSQAYQSQTEVLSQQAIDGQYVYRGPRAKRMTAEQFIDGVWTLTNSAPNKIDAPVFRAKISKVEADQIERLANWIWRSPPPQTETGGGQETDKEKPYIPPAGETILLRKTLQLDSAVVSGGAAITCDNSFVLFINNREVIRGDNWTEVLSIPLHSVLKQGKNEIVALATNAGSEPNLAGFYFDARLKLEDESEMTVVSDESWTWSDKLPNSREGRLGGLRGPWKPVARIPEIDAWKNATELQTKFIIARSGDSKVPMVRASLLNSDFLMRSLGRPLREQIVSSRPSELTTLEAIDLTNGETLAETLTQGGTYLSQKEWQSNDELIRSVFQSALSRSPTDEELALVSQSLESPPSPQQIGDLLWAIVMMPEFMLIR